ncbi:MAG TPA: hypothetical protein P5299_03015, partial [Candidatus Woesebacteria bacterium]|nr:hypothetical protein [Candidatus Woesebacteria bacterium]
MNLKSYFTASKYNEYAAFLKAQKISNASIKRKLSSLASFEKFLIKKGLIIEKPLVTSSSLSKGDIRRTERFKFLNKYTLVAALLIIISALGWGLYNQTILKAKRNLAYSTITSPAIPKRILSFQGRLTDSAGNPINSSTSIKFDLYNTDIGGSLLYTSGSGNSQTVVPDDNGIFSVIIGKSHGDTIPSTVFTENTEVWLQITAGGETMAPRQQIATVAYALNSESLQGLPPSATGLKNTVLVIDNYGNLNLGETSPTIKSTSGILGIEGQAVLIKAADTSGGNIELNPDGNGKLLLSTEGTNVGGTGGLVQLTNGGNLIGGALLYGQVGNDNRNYNFINLVNYDVGTTTYSPRFTISAGGIATLSTGITTPKITLTTGAQSNYLLQSDANGNASWVSPSGVGGTYTAGNGLNLSSSQFKLGGVITEATRLNIGNTEALYIAYPSGNIGIGITNPAAKLHISQGTLIN